MYLDVRPAETGALEQLTELVSVILEDAARVRLPGPPDIPELERLLPAPFRRLVSRPSVREAVEALYRLPYLERLQVYEAFQNDIAFPRHMDDSRYRLSDPASVSERGRQALADLCASLRRIAAKGIPGPQESERGEALFSSALLRRRFREINGEFGRVCPACVREVYYSKWEGDVDHYFPQAAHPALTFQPYNLIPTCADCNGPKNKSSKDPIDRRDAGPGELRTVFLPYLRAASREVELSVLESRDLERDLTISINPGPGGDQWTRRRIENMDRLYNLSSRWSGILEVVCGDIQAEIRQKRAEGVTAGEWPAVLREVLSAAAESTKGRPDFIKGVYCSWLLERNDEELVERFPYQTLSLPQEEA